MLVEQAERSEDVPDWQKTQLVSASLKAKELQASELLGNRLAAYTNLL